MKKSAFILVVLTLFFWLPARADITLNIKLNFFGSPGTGQGGSSVTTSFYFKSMVQRNLQVAFSTEALRTELQRTFNAPKVSLMAEGDLVWKSGSEPSVTQIVQINGRDLALVLTPLPKLGAVNFKVGVVEENNKKNIKTILLDTEIVLPDGEVAVLGFRDAQENSYFIAFCVQGRDEKLSKGVMRIPSSQRPEKIKDAKPVYPADALKNKVQGVVILKVETTAQGGVHLIEVISGHPLFNDAAMAAARQWVFKPYIVNGEAKPVCFTVPVQFLLDEGNDKDREPNAIARLQAGDKRPHKVKHVNPVFPPEAKEKKIAGVVIIEATINEQGKVRMIRVMSSPDPLLSDAALKAVRQWEYEPYIIKGQAKPVVFTATVTFHLNSDESSPPPVPLADSQRPRKIKDVKPVYPEAAVLEKVEGVVVLEVTIDEQGKVKAARIVSYSPPILNQAALDAVRQWRYEPFVKDKKAKPVTFTVTVTFSMDQERREAIPPR